MQALLYVSQETAPLEPDQLMALLRGARANNRRRGITGLLAYRDGQFMQILEGEKAEIQRLFATIEADPRHDAVAVIWRSPIEERDFAAWPMAFRHPSDVQLARLPRFQEALEEGFTGAPLRRAPDLARGLLLTLRDVV